MSVGEGRLSSARLWGALGLLLGLALCLGGGTAQQPTSSCVPSPPGLVAWWPLDETSGTTVVDIVGGHNGTPVPGPIGPVGPTSGPAPVAYSPISPPAVVGGSLFFYGQSVRFVKVPDAPSLNFGTGDFTIDVWVHPVKCGPGWLYPVVDKVEHSPVAIRCRGYSLGIFNNQVHFLLHDWSSTAVTSAPITYGEWSHVAAVRRGGTPNVVEVYVNGVLAAVTTPSVGSVTSAADLLIGGLVVGYPGVGGCGLPAQFEFCEIAIDELQIFNRALTPAEVHAIYKAGSAGKCKGFSCPPGQQLVALQAGEKDNFDPDPDVPPAAPTPAFQTALIAAGALGFVGFDSTTMDRNFAHSFTGLPPGITQAEVEIGLKPLPTDHSTNDRIGFWVGVSPVTGAGSYQLGSPGGLVPNPWNTANYPNGHVFTITLPSSIVAAMNAHGVLHVQVQDDTSVDYVILRLCHLVGRCDLAISKSVRPSPVVSGQQATIAITVTNVGPGTCPGPTIVKDTLPAGMTFVSASGTGWTFTHVGGTVTATYAGSLAPGASASFTTTLNVTAAPGAVLRNCAELTNAADTNPANNNHCIEIPVTGFSCPPGQQLVVLQAGEKDNFDPDPGVPPAAPTSAFQTALIAAGALGFVGFDSTTIDRNFAHSFTGLPPCITQAEVEIGLKPLPTDHSTNDRIGFWVGVSPVTGAASYQLGSPGGLVSNPWNTANYPNGHVFTITLDPMIVTAMNAHGVLHVQVQDDSSVDYVILRLCHLVGRCDLAITKRVSPSPVVSGQQATFTITVTNVGACSCPGPTIVKDTLPAGMTFVSASGTGWTFVHVAGTVTATYAGSLAPGASASFTITLNVTAMPGTVLENCAEVTNAADANPANNRDCIKIPVTGVVGRCDLAISKSVRPSPVVSGQQATIAITVTNVGPGTCPGPTTVKDVLPAGMTYVSASGTGWTFVHVAGTVTATYAGSLAPGGSASFTITVNVTAKPGTVLENCAEVTNAADTNPANNRSCIKIQVAAR